MSFLFSSCLSNIRSTMKLSVPYFSLSFSPTQKNPVDVRGVTCAKMVFDFYGINERSIEDLLYVSGSIGLYDTPPNFMLDSLIVLLKMHGFSARKEYFKNYEIDFALSEQVLEMYDVGYREEGILALAESLYNKRPVITTVSQTENAVGNDKLMLLIGYDKTEEGIQGFYYHDAEHEDKFVSISEFRQMWKRMAVFVG